MRPADEEGIAAAVEALARARLILHPTDTVVSLSGDPYREAAAEAAWRLKGYDAPRPFLCLVPDSRAAQRLAAEWPEPAERLARAFWPGPLTIVVRAGEGAPAPVAAGGTLAMRPASDPVSRALLAAWDGALFSTSANRRGEAAPTRVEDAARDLGERPGGDAIALALRATAPEEAAAGQPSSIVDVTGAPRLVRWGAIPLERLRETVPDLETLG